MGKHRMRHRHRVVRALRAAPQLVRRPAVAAPLAVLVASGTAVGAMSAALTGHPAPAPANAAAGVTTSATVADELPDLPARAPRKVEPAATTLASYAEYAQTAADIPDEALVAYQRAATVMAQAAPRCHLEWSVLAAIGRVASDHGGDDVAEAAFVEGGRRALPDTDGGALDGDAEHDLPVGPLRLLPATWTVVAVDGDNDGTRDADDLDDAALAAGVVLCGEERDLERDGDFRQALRMFNTAPRYPSVISRLARAYERRHGGDVPDTLLAAGAQAPSSTTTAASDPDRTPERTPDPSVSPTDDPWSDAPTDPGDDNGVTSFPSNPTDKPTDRPTKTPDETDPTGSATPTSTPCPSPTPEPTEAATDEEPSPSASLTPCTSSATSPTASFTPSTAGPAA